jgi:hypothetical protein
MDKYNKHRFRLISPIVGNKIYSSSSVKHVAKKCMDELKSNLQTGGKKYTKFAILDIDNYTTYKFNINYHQKNHNHNLPLNGSLFGTNNQTGGMQINDLADKINKLEERISKLENNINELHNDNDENNDKNKDKIMNGGMRSNNNMQSNNCMRSISNHSSYEKEKSNIINNKPHSEQPYMS